VLCTRTHGAEGVEVYLIRGECNRLLHLNRGLPGSAVYDFSTDRQLRDAFKREMLKKAGVDTTRVTYVLAAFLGVRFVHGPQLPAPYRASGSR
jgi:hypothetical protein